MAILARDAQYADKAARISSLTRDLSELPGLDLYLTAKETQMKQN